MNRHACRQYVEIINLHVQYVEIFFDHRGGCAEREGALHLYCKLSSVMAKKTF